MKTPRLQKYKLHGFSGIILLLIPLMSVPLTAQDAEEEEVFELSPFEVQAEEGWLATETLAGSRLRTEFSDLAGQFETLTMEFMDEFGVNSIEEAAIYSLNMESREEFVSGNGLQDDLNGGLRIRGLSGPTNSIEFFGTQAPSDNYNIERITIASGPNSILFGTGSPAGVVDRTLKKATMSNHGKLKLQMDSFGGDRAEVDINKVLIDGKLAVRIASVYDQTSWDIADSGELDKRIYGTLTYRPFENTTIRGHYEAFDIWSNRPSRLYPFDGFTPWFTADSRPTAGFPAQHIFQNTADWYNGIDLNGDGDFTDEGEQVPQYLPPGSELFEVNGSEGRALIVGGIGANGASIPIGSWANSVDIRPPELWSTVPIPNREGDGYTVLDDTYVPTHVNLAAASRISATGGDIYHLFLTQKVFEDMYFEMGYKNERVDARNMQLMDYLGSLEIKVDPNAFLPDGVTPNPNVGRFYMEGNRPQYDIGYSASEDVRATLSYEFDFVDKLGDNWFNRLIGRHRLAGLVSRNEFEEKKLGMGFIIPPKTGPDGQLYFPAFEHMSWPDVGTPDNPVTRIDLGNTYFGLRYYLGDNDWNAKPWPGFTLGDPTLTLTDSNGEVWRLDPENTGIYDEYGRRLVRGSVPSVSKTRLDTKQFAYQGYFWKNRIIATLGYRDDEILQATSVNGIGEDDFWELRPHVMDTVFDEFSEPESGTTRTRGIVVHPLEDIIRLPFGMRISAFYNESDTFQPNTAAYRPWGGTYPGALGDGVDKGFAIRSEDGKFTLRYSEFENTAGPQRAGNTPFNRIRWQFSSFENRMSNNIWPEISDQPPNPPATIVPDEAYNNLGNGDPYWVVSYRKATGKEISLSWNPTPNWDFRATYTTQEAIESDIGLEWFNDEGTGWIDQRIEQWKTIDIPEGAWNPRDINGDGVIGRWTWENLPWNVWNGQGELFKDRLDRILINGSTGINVIKALDGKSNEFVRDGRMNLNAMYRFRDGKLKGLNVGAAVRYREKPLVSYGNKELGGTTIVDLDNPIYGDKELFLDLTFRYSATSKWLGDRRYTVGMVVRNATDESDIYVLYNGAVEPIRRARVGGRQFLLQFEIEL